MPNSEDYLDGLLNSINEAKTNVEKARVDEEESIKAKIADMSSIDPNDDFMSATGISGFKPKKMSHDNLRKAFSEADFLKDFEEELSSGSADDFIREFEQEIDDEEERFQRGEEIPDDAGSEFIRSLMEEDGVEPEDELKTESTEEPTEPEESEIYVNEEEVESTEEPTATEDELKVESTEVPTETDVVDNTEESIEPEVADSTEDSIEPEVADNTEDSIEPEVADNTEAEVVEESEPKEEVDTSAEDAEELLAALGEDASSDESDSTLDTSNDASDNAPSEEGTNEEDIANSQELLDILDEVENIVGDDDKSKTDNPDENNAGDDESILSKEYQSDEHDEVDALEVNEEGVSLVDEDADLESLLEGEEGMSDIGDLLNADENDIELDEARDAFEESADKAENSAETVSEEEPKEKVSLIDKIKGIFKKKKKGEGEEEKEILDVAAKNEVEDTTEENKKILEEMDEEEAEELAKKQAKAEAKAEKKAAKKAAKEEKKAAKAAAKAEKAKQEKKPGKLATFLQSDKSNKIPVKVLVVFVLLVGTLVALLIIGSNIFSKRSAISEAKSLYSQGNYIDAYNSLAGISSLSEEDTEIMNKARLLADLQNKKKEYDTFMAKKDYMNAFDALVVGVGRYNENYEKAKEYGITAEYDGVESMITGQLKDQFGTTKEEAEKLYEIKGRTKYTVAISDKLKALGMESNGSNN
ncbi:MAG: hypothetical protein IJU02_08960 [Lachnospiraceae bacterium]|nr:hypothetical protein [Lachnospiraceae bacterium]